ncbi:hypothetical protein QO015_003043 [Kaistia geumhonensis]|uniref:Uncharacterized protein n=1 Tax=Kaistia geumhonensis TaxID=410839 RepID=A0ABU0M8Y9_9HYPH|nr:hypothetical protein [Kaistia geumhonensis]
MAVMYSGPAEVSTRLFRKRRNGRAARTGHCGKPLPDGQEIRGFPPLRRYPQMVPRLASFKGARVRLNGAGSANPLRLALNRGHARLGCIGRSRRRGSEPGTRAGSLPSSLFPLPSSLFPLPSSLFPLPSSLFPLPSSLRPDISEPVRALGHIDDTKRGEAGRCVVVAPPGTTAPASHIEAMSRRGSARCSGGALPEGALTWPDRSGKFRYLARGRRLRTAEAAAKRPAGATSGRQSER